MAWNKEAAKWYRLAADQGDAEAQCNLGILYHEGQGVAQNNILAVKWLLLTANQRNADTQRILGTLHEQGHGVARSYVRALMWYKLAAMSGDEEAPEHIDSIKNLMTPTQRAEADKSASDW
jgi:TPR repeat protein